LGATPQAMEPPGVDGFPHGQGTPFRMVVGGLIEDVAHPAFVNQARDTSQMGHDRRAAQWRRGRKSRAVRGSHRRRLCRGEWIDTPKLLKGTCVVRNVGFRVLSQVFLWDVFGV
jgi:hypothetical protein